MIKRLSDFQSDIMDFYQTGIQRGEYCGFESLDEYYTCKSGSMTFILASPHSGKTEFVLEILLNLSISKGQKHLIFTPETGDYKDIAGELISKFCKKPFFKSSAYGCTEAEIYNAINFLDDKFFIVDTDENNFSFDDIISGCKAFESEKGMKINNIVFDPYNEVKHDMKDYGTRQDLYIEDATGKLRRFAKKENKHIFICMHPQEQAPITDSNGVTYYPAPHPRQSAGGQSFFRKAMSFIVLWRPPQGVIDPQTNQPYADNELHVHIRKAKPKGSGKLGMCKLYFDWRTNRYYEDSNGYQYYAFDLQKKNTQGKETASVQPLIRDIIGKEFKDEVPF
jgi:hypothetical protein